MLYPHTHGDDLWLSIDCTEKRTLVTLVPTVLALLEKLPVHIPIINMSAGYVPIPSTDADNNTVAGSISSER